MSSTPRKTRSQGPAEDLDLDHPFGGAEADSKLMGLPPPTRLERELAFYATYHSDPINKAIHMVFIPTIYVSGAIILSHLVLTGTPIIRVSPSLVAQLNAALPFTVGYCLYYFGLDPIAGSLFIPIGVFIYLWSTHLTQDVPSWVPWKDAFGKPSVLPFAIVVQVSAWIGQFIGHGFFEHRAPALLTNLTQAFILAPFFVFLEFLMAVFNYRPEVLKRAQNLAAVSIKELNKTAKAHIS